MLSEQHERQIKLKEANQNRKSLPGTSVINPGRSDCYVTVTVDSSSLARRSMVSPFSSPSCFPNYFFASFFSFVLILVDRVYLCCSMRMRDVSFRKDCQWRLIRKLVRNEIQTAQVTLPEGHPPPRPPTPLPTQSHSEDCTTVASCDKSIAAPNNNGFST